MRVILMCAGLISLALSVAAHSQTQTPAESSPKFDVASVKRSSPQASGVSFGAQPGGRWSMVNGLVETLIRQAYVSQMYDLSRSPDWVRAEHYDIQAKSERNPDREQMRLMLQALLAERFGLVVHSEVQERPILALVVARSDGRLGERLRRSTIDCEAVTAARREGRSPAVSPSNGAPACGFTSNGAEIRAGGVPISRLPGMLGPQDGRIIIDKTGLSGNFEFTLTLSNDLDTAPYPLSTALEDQLGLKLEAQRAAVQVLVVDQVQRPTED